MESFHYDSAGYIISIESLTWALKGFFYFKCNELGNIKHGNCIFKKKFAVYVLGVQILIRKLGYARTIVYI